MDFWDEFFGEEVPDSSETGLDVLKRDFQHVGNLGIEQEPPVFELIVVGRRIVELEHVQLGVSSHDNIKSVKLSNSIGGELVVLATLEQMDDEFL